MTNRPLNKGPFLFFFALIDQRTAVHRLRLGVWGGVKRSAAEFEPATAKELSPPPTLSVFSSALCSPPVVSLSPAKLRAALRFPQGPAALFLFLLSFFFSLLHTLSFPSLMEEARSIIK